MTDPVDAAIAESFGPFHEPEPALPLVHLKDGTQSTLCDKCRQWIARSGEDTLWRDEDRNEIRCPGRTMTEVDGA